jgi:hypothetical protein
MTCSAGASSHVKDLKGLQCALAQVPVPHHAGSKLRYSSAQGGDLLVVDAARLL